jgi:carbon storage regulator
MLVLMRRVNESILIGDNIRVTVTKIAGGQVQIGIAAPRDITIVREELVGTPRPTRRDAIPTTTGG